MSSVICQNFVQNAWKKELCSNCFKSKDEHAERPKPKPITLISNDSVEGIIRNGSKFKPKRSVCFTKDLTEIIGFGGEDWESDGEDPEEESSSEDDFVAESEEEETDRELKRITKENTDFNTTSLKEEIKKPPQLMLGQPLVGKPLLVTVTPFGEDAPPSPKRFIKTISHIPISKTTNKETVPETKQNNVVLTSYTKNQEEAPTPEEKSLLDEISETLENSKNPIQIMARRKIQKEIVLSVGKPAKGLSRTPALKRDQEKPVIYQTSTAKIELLNIKNSKLSKEETTKSSMSREQAGEPDGRADDVIAEPPALPLTPPPPLETQNSFLHNNNSNSPIYEKPKIPSKPTTVPLRKPVVMTTFGGGDAKPLLCKQDSTGSESGVRGGNKRRAPKPPDDQIYSRNSLNSLKIERASSCSPKIRDQEELAVPEVAPRRIMSVSTDSLVIDEKRKPKGRFSLKKFLRMGSSNKELKLDIRPDESEVAPPLPKPRLVIVHPSELNGARVEVVAAAKSVEQNDYENLTPKKPPPPPRNDDHKPVLPPPKSVEVLNKQKQYNGGSIGKKAETVYANIGEVRSAIVPNKPQRTASMREREAQQQKQNNYEPIENVYDYINSGRSSSPDSADSSQSKSSPTCPIKTGRLNKRSESSIDVSGDYFKYSNIPRSLSLTYCGSETESEIYSPYSFYGSESEVTEDDHDWIQNGRTHKLRSRKGRSIVHKNLEDNYGAVVVANHEALAQVLENIQQTNHIQPALRGLKSLPNLRFTDFVVKSTSQPVVLGCRTFHHATWNGQHVTLVVNTGAVPSSTLALGTCSLTTITEFSDLVPEKFLGGGEVQEEEKYIQATVSVLPWLQVSTIQSYSDSLKLRNPDETLKDASFILLQLVNALKNVQAQGIEELSLSLNSFILCKEMDKESHQRLCVLQGLGEDPHGKNSSDKYGTLCMCASKALSYLQPASKITPLLQSLLNNERAVTLTQVKSILEFCLWGPSDVALGSTIRERELGLQRWLDLQRATVLHGLVCARVQLTVYEECHLFFLVRSNARMMCDASLLLESSYLKHSK